jgi:glycosyltransferase involved in cell wall biosynthesis
MTRTLGAIARRAALSSRPANFSMPSLSATIIAFNEAQNIARTMRSLAMTNEIIVVDSGSTDSTVEIARQCGARVVHHDWEGFAAQKNFAAAGARHDWILSLDADEELNGDAQAAVARWKGLQPQAAGYRFARRARYLGRWILHSGWYPDYKLRLYDRRAGEWRGAYVHESAVVSGSVETLPGEILHYTCDSLEEHQKRIEFYTDLAAREMYERRMRVRLPARLVVPSWTFLQSYFMRLGILDGYQGFLIAKMAARYVRRKYQKWQALESPRGQP